MSDPHAHSHDVSEPAPPRTRRIVVAVLVPLMVLTAVMVAVLWPPDIDAGPNPQGDDQRAYGTVSRLVTVECPADAEPGPDGGELVCGTATVRIESGPGRGRSIDLSLPNGPGAPRLTAGDDVVLVRFSEVEPGQPEYAITDHQRGRPLLILIALAAAAIVAFGRWRGLAALVGLAVSFAVLLVFIIPGILAGSSPLLVAVVGAAAIMFAVLYLTHGVNVHTSVAILGTLASLVLTGLLGAGFTGLTHLTGVADEQSLYLSTSAGQVDLRGLLLAGIIIGSLGVLDDVTVTQAATVAELSRAPRSRLDLYRAAARVGRAHVASAVNTIVLAYAGASLPLLLLVAASGADVSDLLTGELIGQELVRSAVGTIGLVASVPITTALAVAVATPAADPAVKLQG